MGNPVEWHKSTNHSLLIEWSWPITIDVNTQKHGGNSMDGHWLTCLQPRASNSGQCLMTWRQASISMLPLEWLDVVRRYTFVHCDWSNHAIQRNSPFYLKWRSGHETRPRMALSHRRIWWNEASKAFCSMAVLMTSMSVTSPGSKTQQCC